MNDNLVGKVVKWKRGPVVVRGEIVALAPMANQFKLVVQDADGELKLYDYSDLTMGPYSGDFEAVHEFYGDPAPTSFVTAGAFETNYGNASVPVVTDMFETKSGLMSVQDAMDSIGFTADSEAFAELPPESNTADRACYLLKTLFDELQDAASEAVSRSKYIVELELAASTKPKRGRPKKEDPGETAP